MEENFSIPFILNNKRTGRFVIPPGEVHKVSISWDGEMYPTTEEQQEACSLLKELMELALPPSEQGKEQIAIHITKPPRPVGNQN